MIRYKMKLQILSPVHIGTGYEIPPYEYVVKGGNFYRINLYGFLSSLPPAMRKEFDTALNNTNPTFVRKFIADNADVGKFSLYKCVVQEDFEEAYKDKISDVRNQLLVNEIPKQLNDYRPYIPGSSIKGAIRTAVVSEFAKEKRVNFVKNPKFFEKDLFNYPDAKQDPFRCIKISDAPLEDKNKIFISGAENFNPKKDSSSTIQMFCEQICSLLDEEPNIYATGEFAFDEQLPQKTFIDRNRNRQNAVSMEIDPARVLKSCKAFYLPKIQEEFDNFYKGREYEDYIKPLLDVEFADNEYPIRVGHYSHCECTTVDDVDGKRLRRPKTRRGRDGKPLPWGKTRTLSRGVPFGWVKVILEPIKTAGVG